MSKFKTLLAATGMVLATTLAANAAPIAAGSAIGFTGLFAAVDASGNEAANFASATGIDFFPRGGGSGQIEVNSRTGDFSSIAVGTIGMIKDFQFATALPISDFYMVGGLSFVLRNVTSGVFSLGGTDFLTVSGQGDLRLAGFDATPGTFTFSGQTDGLNSAGNYTFTFSAGSAAIPEPATLALFGTALLGLGLAGRARRKQDA